LEVQAFGEVQDDVVENGDGFVQSFGWVWD
jgi:hypothetical protein